jgi:hypothetical protein
MTRRLRRSLFTALAFGASMMVYSREARADPAWESCMAMCYIEWAICGHGIPQYPCEQAFGLCVVGCGEPVEPDEGG